MYAFYLFPMLMKVMLRTLGVHLKQKRKPFFTRAILKTGAPNDNKITLDTTRSKVSHVYVTSVPESQISFRFYVRLSVSDLIPLLSDYYINFCPCVSE